MGESLGAFRWPQQGDEREQVQLADQWGRVWDCTWDFGKNARAPVSVLLPLGWHDRLLTPSKYMRFSKGRSDRFEIDAQAWVNDLEYEHEQYRNRLGMEAMAMSPADAGGALLGADPDGEHGFSTIAPALLRRVGPPPNPIAPIRALQAGNRYVLGLTDKMPAWAAPYFTPKRAAVSEFPDAEDEDTPEPETPQDENGVLRPPMPSFPDADEEDERPLAAFASAGSGGGKRRR